MFLDRPEKQYTLEEKALRAERAKRLVQDGFFDECLEIVETNAIKALVSSPAADVGAGDRARALITVCQSFKDHLIQVISDGPLDSQKNA